MLFDFYNVFVCCLPVANVFLCAINFMYNLGLGNCEI